MDGVIDGGSPRRGSLNSLHRQPSGSFSYGTKLASPTGSVQVNGNPSLYKDLDRFTRYFIIKSVQVVVQSRIVGNRKMKTECKPNGNDWFNINIADIAEVSEQTKAALGSEGLSVRSNWRVCCEISLQTSDGVRVVLEHWIISNRANSNPNTFPSKLNANQRGSSNNRSTNLLTSNNGSSPLSAINSMATTRANTSVFNQKLRSRLNSIDDCSGDSDTSNRVLSGANNENFDMKSSASCFSLSSAPTNQTAEPANTIANSPSISSLSNTLTQGQSNATNSNSQQGYKTSAMSSIYTIYNRMSLLLKTLMTTTHIVPAYRLASRGSAGDSYVICYRVYVSSYQNSKSNLATNKGSTEDISPNSTPDSPNKRSSSTNSSIGSLNIRDYVSSEELDHFCPILKLGTIKTDVNELDVSLCYRTDVKDSKHLLRSSVRSRETYNKLLDEECITAAKQLLAGNENNNHNTHLGEPYGAHHRDEQHDQELYKTEALNYIDQPLRPAFAAKEPKAEQDHSLLVETAFEGLLRLNEQSNSESTENVETRTTVNLDKSPSKDLDYNHGPAITSSEPIQVPKRGKQIDLCQNLSSGSTPKSLTDSFVFVDLNPPFASEEQNDINSFFHGPSPTFHNGFETFKDVDDLTNQLAVIEASANKIDEFIDNICVSEDEEEV